MISCQEFYEALGRQGIDYFTGVPDSLLKDFCGFVADHAKTSNHIIAANEGAAVSLAAGFHLATDRIGLVYLQNSGLGNTINPLTSLTDPEVYSIPVLLLIGWRGEPGVADEPQHRKQGRVTEALLKALEIPYAILPEDISAAENLLKSAVNTMRKSSAPFALLVKKGTFAVYELKKKAAALGRLTREAGMQHLLRKLNRDEIIVSSTGMLSREVFEYRASSNLGHFRDFLTVGCMGHCSQIALGLAQQKTRREVWCLDGDGAVLMHMGSLAIIGTSSAKNFRHVIFNNGAHDSVGGQPTVGFAVDFVSIANACGYSWTGRASTFAEIESALLSIREVGGPTFLEIRVNPGARKTLGRPTVSTWDNKREFTAYVQD